MKYTDGTTGGFMSEHRTTLHWTRTTGDFDYKTYSRDHTVTFKNGQALKMSAAIAYRGSANLIDPEEAFVASLSSCHMLTFLALASNRKLIVDEYVDEAVGHLEKNAKGKLAITRVTLRPRVTFGNGSQPDAQTLDHLHHKSHEECFIANSVITEVTVEPSTTSAPHR
jgi:organic hydroperoxide reductase OsmC/OhrA